MRHGQCSGRAPTDQETGDGLGDRANGKARKGEGGPDVSANDGADADDLMPGKNAQTGARAAKADAGKNGTGAGFELGQGAGTDDRSTSDDQNEEIDAKPGAAVSGDNSGMPARAKAPTKKGLAIKTALAAIADALAKFDGDGDEDDAMVSDDDSTNGVQSRLPARAKSPTTKGLGGGDGGAHTSCPTDLEVRTVGSSGEGARQAGETGAMDHRPEDQADGEAGEAGGKVAGKTRGKTLDMSGVPAGAQSPASTGGARKNDGDARIGRKGNGKQLPDEESGTGEQSAAGAQAQDVQTFKSDVAIMQAISALAKSVEFEHRRGDEDGDRSF